jgi:hypothetical protein
LRELSLHLLDIAENSISAKAKNITIEVIEDLRTDLLQLSVQDDGCGMSPEMAASVVDPFVTTRTTRKVGLGIPLLKEAAEACNGSLKLESKVGEGTRIWVQFQHSHIDRMPLGDIVTTILHLEVANPAVHWVFRYSFNGHEFVFDDAPVKAELEGVPLSEPSILSCLREMLQSGISEAKANHESYPE